MTDGELTAEIVRLNQLRRGCLQEIEVIEDALLALMKEAADRCLEKEEKPNDVS